MNEERIDPFRDRGFMTRLEELRADQKDGVIEELALFQEVKLSEANIAWKASFKYVQDGQDVFEAFKLKTDPAFKLIVKLWSVYGPGILVLSEYRNGKTRFIRTIEPLTKLDQNENKQ